ncbi:DUF732 domain-containing protein [Rhodococcus artemisiae]|uniref:DUF732 domain-containing protein n=1 Tax=Rhodococcus artemisiae TaxID=714159 RepID=A0ABU7LER8_9NOCA|nr:DUF732 domain-containing protein [Rhodococcus artemisiae]MEE2060043.1 DUF732 domain-containing protein [Rhodococcus artemisiae]
MLTLGWLPGRRSGRRAARTLVLVGAGAAAVSCATGTATVEQSTTAATTSTTSARPEQKAPLLDSHAMRFKNALADSGLAAGVPDETLLAVGRGLCSRLADGAPEDEVVDVVRPIAAYATTVSDTMMPGDDAARLFIVVAREEFC